MKIGRLAAGMRWTVLALMGLVLLGLAPARALAEATPVQILNQTMEGTLKLKPGDIIAIGYTLRVQKPHPAATLRLSGLTVTLKARCEGDPYNSPRNISLFMEEGSAVTVAIAQDDERWTPTRDTNQAVGFQASMPTPGNLCGDAAIIVDEVSGGVDFSAYIEASQPGLTVDMKFHYRVPAAKGFANIDCSSLVQNRSPGTPACLAKWSAVASTSPGVFALSE